MGAAHNGSAFRLPGRWICASVTMSDRRLRLDGLFRNARKPPVLTSITRHIRPKSQPM
ncbi:hypothetical protein Z947_2685 [Sulfitobacter geojensis]|nr:hypothetical protein Z947_2685 [Sulfitobacter geojensis]